MIESITVTNYLGESLTIKLGEANPESGLLITSIDGLGPVNSSINMTELATTDGSKYNSSKFQERNIVVHLRFVESYPELTDNYKELTFNIENSRQRVYKYFPGKRELTFSIKTDNRNLRAVGYVESNEPNIFSKESGCTISIICPDPYLYSNEDGYSPHQISFSGLDSEFQFPFSNESITNNLILFGNIVPIIKKSFTYFGDQEVGVKMKILFKSEVDTNIRVEKRLPSDPNKIMAYFLLEIDKLNALVGTNFATGDEVTIDTTNGQKRILMLRNGEYLNILNVVSRDSDWFQLNKGENIFFMTAYGNEQNLLFYLENYVVYEGV